MGDVFLKGLRRLVITNPPALGSGLGVSPPPQPYSWSDLRRPRPFLPVFFFSACNFTEFMLSSIAESSEKPEKQEKTPNLMYHPVIVFSVLWESHLMQ